MSRNELLGEVALIRSHNMLGSRLSCPTFDESLQDEHAQSGFGDELSVACMAKLQHRV